MKGQKKLRGHQAKPSSASLWQALAGEVQAVARRWGCAVGEVVAAIAAAVDGAGVRDLEDALLSEGGRGGEARPGGEGGAWDGFLSDEVRRAHGVHFTPELVAQRLVALVGELEAPGPIVDPACGAGALLLAADGRWPQRALVGVERDAGLAMVAALRLLDARRGRAHEGVRVLVGDGLLRLPVEIEGRVAAVVMNPPYVPEKGNAAMLKAVVEAHPRLEEVRGARTDLLYYFLVRSVEMLADGGQAAWLTPPHWLGADGARRMRAWLLEQGVMERFEWWDARGVFEATPGQEVLLAVFRRGEARRTSLWRAVPDRAALAGGELSSWKPVQPLSLRVERWNPRADAQELKWGERRRREGRALGALVRDFQGVVSGADRVTRRHETIYGGEYGWEVGAPIFLSEGAEPPAAWAPLASFVRPLLRSGRLEASRIYTGDEVHGWMLDLRHEVDDAWLPAVEEVLGRYRPILEARREVRLGKMPWYRLHWPRDGEAMAAPKLVVPRRAKRPCFALDLSGAVVSSDCTFLVAPAEIKAPVSYLQTLMEALNGEETERYLRVFGKKKGELLEFYSSPLRELPVIWPPEGGAV